MARYPLSPENMPSSNSGISDDDRTHRLGMTWFNMGQKMVKLGMHMQQCGYHMMHDGTLFRQVSSDETAGQAESKQTNDETKRPAAQEGTNASKSTRLTPPSLPFDFDFCAASTPVTPTFMSHIASKTPLDIPPLNIDKTMVHSFPHILPDLDDMNIPIPSNIFPTAGAASNVGYDQDLVDQDIKRWYDLPDQKPVGGQEKKQGKTKEATYLKKCVANTTPKVSLKTYLKQNDGNLICLCGRGGHNNHPGNQDYRDFVSKHLQDYLSTSDGRKEKLTNSIVQAFENEGRRFFDLNNDDEWEEMDQDSARTKIRAKISQRFRDARSRQKTS